MKPTVATSWKLQATSYKLLVVYPLLLATYGLLLLPSYVVSQELTPLNQEATLSVGASPPRYAIGVILPLRGEYADFGEEALKGVLLATGVFAKDETPPVEILVKDSGEDPTVTAKAVEDVANDERVIGIVGPLLSGTALEAVRKAQRLRVPIITLSQREDLTKVGDHVFRNSLTPSIQARGIAHYAVDVLGFKRFAILYPENPYGIELVNHFKEEVKKGAQGRAGEVVAEGSYQEGQTDFGKEIRRLFKVKETEKREGRRHIKFFEPTLVVDALYIPDYYDTVTLIVSHLAYYNVKGVRLLGSNGWNSPMLVEQGGRFVEGAVFVDGFFPDSPRPEVRFFVNGFRSTFGVESGILGAQAYDATRILIQLLKEGREDRGRIKEGLARLKGFKGATGTITFEGGEAVKGLFILTVRDGRIVEVN